MMQTVIGAGPAVEAHLPSVEEAVVRSGSAGRIVTLAGVRKDLVAGAVALHTDSEQPVAVVGGRQVPWKAGCQAPARSD